MKIERRRRVQLLYFLFFLASSLTRDYEGLFGCRTRIVRTPYDPDKTLFVLRNENEEFRVFIFGLGIPALFSSLEK